MGGREAFWADEQVMPHHHDAEYAEFTSAVLTAQDSGKRKALLMRLLRATPDGLTDWEMTEAIEKASGHRISHDNTKATRNTLMRQGWVLPTGRHRAGPFGKPNEVWVAIPEGAEPVPIPNGLKRPLPRRAPKPTGPINSIIDALSVGTGV